MRWQSENDSNGRLPGGGQEVDWQDRDWGDEDGGGREDETLLQGRAEPSAWEMALELIRRERMFARRGAHIFDRRGDLD